MKKYLLLIPTAAIALMGAGCSPSAQTNSSSSASVEDEDADKVEEVVELPADFPADLPMYPGATLTYASMSTTYGASASFDSNDSMDTVYAWYEAALTADGWTKTAGGKDTSISAVFEKDNASITFSAYEISGVTSVNIGKTVYDY